MLIAVEGPDGAGKSTFVEILRQIVAKDHDVEVRHSGPPTAWPVSEYELGTQDYRPGRDQNIIYDRLHVGEQVYGPIYRGKGMAPAEWEHVNGWLNRLGCVTVFVMPPIDEVKENLGNRGDDMVLPPHLDQIYRGYSEVLVGYKLARQVLYSYPTERDAYRAVKLAMRIEKLYADTAHLNSFVGWKSPDCLLIGDAKSSMAGDHVQAFVPWPRFSGEFLMNAIVDRYVTWALINAEDDDVAEAVRLIRPATVTTLGAVANAACAHAGVGVDANAWHPSYALRRRGLSIEQYKETI